MKNCLNTYETPLLFENINPFVRYSHHFTIDENSPFINVAAYDYRLIYIIKGEGTVVVNGRRIEVCDGSLLFWSPGDNYSYLPADNSAFRVYGINFDFTSNYVHLGSPIAPERQGKFRNEMIIEKVKFENSELFNNIVHLSQAQPLERLIATICEEHQMQKVFYQGKIQGLMISLLNEIARKSAVPKLMVKKKTYQLDDILSYIQNNYTKPLNNKGIAEHLNFHPSYLSRVMAKYTGYPLNQYIIRYRISIAVNLLQTTNLSVSEVAEKVGFNDSNYFTRCFKKVMGMRPRDFQIGNHNG